MQNRDTFSKVWLSVVKLYYTRPFLISRFLEDNNISEINNFDFGGFSEEKDGREPEYLRIFGLKKLYLGNCSIQKLSGRPFEQLESLERLDLVNNNLDNEGLGKALHRHPSLKTIILSGNRLTSVPRMPVSEFPKLQKMFLSHNRVSSISREDFAEMTELEELDLSFNPLEGFPEEDDTFKDSPELTVARFDHTHLTRLPNMTYLPRLQKLHADHSRLTHLPQDLCASSTELAVLEIQDNLLTEIPTLSCKHLIDLDLSHNRLHTLHEDLLKGMPLVRAFNLGNNQISTLDDRFFENSINMQDLQLGANSFSSLPRLNFMPHLVRLNVSHNHLTSIPEGTFVDQVKLDSLYLNENDIAYIDPLSFPVNSELKILNLSLNSRLSEWVLPHGGFKEMAVLHMEELFQLHQVPHIFEIRNVRELYLTYSYHCCIWDEHIGVRVPNTTEEEGSGHSIIISHPTAPPPTDPISTIDKCNIPQEVIDFYKDIGVEICVDEDCEITLKFLDEQGDEQEDHFSGKDKPLNEIIHRISSRTHVNLEFKYREKVMCTPHENPLTPCRHLLDPWILKAVWLVWVLALLGNGAVLFIGIASREKLESHDILICNLAFADFCMGVYLAFLAIVDVRTFGSSFYQSALDWQLGPGCKAAGFIAIFSSELSIYLLVVLTLERVYTLSHTFNQNERKKRRVAFLLCAIGWVLAFVLALLPMLGVNSYDRVAVCLPYVTEKWTDRFYIGFILTANFVGFLIILFSYMYIFWVACKVAPASDVAQRRKDMLVAASRIAVVIVTAFLCWAPIAVVGYLALIDIDLVDVNEAKFFIVFVYPLNACVNPFIYFLFTKRFRSKMRMLFRRSKDRVTSFPPNHHMRIQRTQSAFTSEYPLTRVSSTSSSNRPEELMKIRQSRRSSSLVVQMVDTSLDMSSPTFHPPSGCNLGRRASLPPGFGSTLNVATGSDPHSHSHLPHYSIPFRLGSVYSSNNSSLPNLQEESDLDLENDATFSASMEALGERANPLTSSQESNLRRLSVVKEEESEADLIAAVSCADDDRCFDNQSVVSSSSEDYSDASDSMECLGGIDGGTDLDCILGSDPRHSVVVEVRVSAVNELAMAPKLNPPPPDALPPIKRHLSPHLLDETEARGERLSVLEADCTFDSALDESFTATCQSKSRSCEDIYAIGGSQNDAPVQSPLSDQATLMSRSTEGIFMSGSFGKESANALIPITNLHISDPAKSPDEDYSSPPPSAATVGRHSPVKQSSLDSTDDSGCSVSLNSQQSESTHHFHRSALTTAPHLSPLTTTHSPLDSVNIHPSPPNNPNDHAAPLRSHSHPLCEVAALLSQTVTTPIQSNSKDLLSNYRETDV